MNLKIKFRESFRPFAPAVLREHVQEHFELDRPSPYMLLVAPVRHADAAGADGTHGLERLRAVRSPLPAVIHVDRSARVQTVDRRTNARFHAVIDAFRRRTGVPVLVNTSFNVRGEPIVGSPEDAYRCFMRTEMDYLVIENFRLAKPDQPPVPKDESWMQEFELD